MIVEPIPKKPVPLGYRRQLAWLIRQMDRYEVTGVEIGVAGGNLSHYLLNRLPGLRLYMVDPWYEVSEDDCYRHSGSGMAAKKQVWWDAMFTRACKVAELYPARGLIMRLRSLDVADILVVEPDFVFLDGDHSEHSVHADLRAWWKKLKPGGLLSGHDYGRPRFPAVKPCVDKFAASIGKSVNFDKKIWWLWKD